MQANSRRRFAASGIGEKQGEFVRGQKQFGNRLSYSTRTASAYLNYPQQPFSFTGVAGFVGDARSLCGAACPRSEFCSFCYAEKHCRFCYYKAKRFNPHSRRRYAASGVGKRSEPQVYFVAICLRNNFSSWIRRRAAYPRCFFGMHSHISKQCPTPLRGVFIQKESG